MRTTKYLRLGILGVLVFLLVGIMVSTAFLPNPAPIVVENTSLNFSSPSVCTTPGQFWANTGVDISFYRNLYLGYCSRRGEETPVVFVETPTETFAVTPVATLMTKIKKVIRRITATPLPPTETSTPVSPVNTQPPATETSTPIPPTVMPPPATETPVETSTPNTPDKECKNKNSGKDGTPSECNAGKGQEKHRGDATEESPEG